MKTILWSLCAILLLIQSPTQAQFNNWSHYYSDLIINDVFEEPTCFWIGTDRGLFQVDKATQAATHYNKTNSVLPDNHIQTITKDLAGNLWIGTYDLAMAIIPSGGGAWPLVSYPTLPNSIKVYCSAVAPNGDIWVGCNQGLIQYDGQNWTHHPFSGISLNIGPVWEIAINSSGKIYAASLNLLTFENGQWYEHRDSGITTAAYTKASLALQNDSTVWYFTDANKVYQFDGNDWQNWSVLSDLPVQPNLTQLYIKVKGSGEVYYNASNNMLGYFDGNQWQADSSMYLQIAQQGNFGNLAVFSFGANNDFWAFGTNKALKYENANASVSDVLELHPFNFNTSLHPDRTGVMHTLNYNDGIYRIEASGWTNLPVSVVGNPVAAYTDLAFDMQNEKWLIAQIAGILTVIEEQNGSWIAHDNSTSMGVLPSTSTIFDVAISQQNTIWILDSDENIYLYKNNSWSVLNPIAPNASTSDFMADNAGNMWWVERSNTGVFSLKKHDGTNLQSYAFPQNSGVMLAPVLDASGNIWMAASNGNLYKFDGTNFSTINYATAAVSPQSLVARGDEIFVATSSHGLYRFNGSNWTQKTMANSALNDDDIRQMAFDALGNLWLDLSVGKVIDLWQLGLLSTNKSTENELGIDVQLSPNPCQDVLQIKIDGISDGNLTIFDVQGRAVFSTIVRSNTTTLDLGNLPAAMYWLRLEAAGVRIVRPLVKQ